MPPELNDGQAPGLEPNDDARLPAGDTPPAAPAAGGDTPAAPPMDSDDAELAAAREALAREEAAAAAAGQQPGGEQPQPQPGAASQDSIPAAAGTEGAPAKPSPMVPHAVFHKERQGRQLAEREADFLRGKVEALEAIQGAAPAQPAATGMPAAPPPAVNQTQAAIDAAQAEINALAEKADLGEITFAELEKARAPLASRIVHLQTQAAIAASMPQPAGPSLADTAIITAHLTTLDKEFPHSRLLTQEQAQWLANRELDKARAFGRPYGTDRKADLDLQAAVAAQAEQFFAEAGVTVPPEIVAEATAAKQRRSGGAQQQGKPGQPALSPEAQARLRKMDMAAGLPPDTAAMGSGSTGIDLSDAAISAMDEEQIAALPAATRQRILNMTG